MFSACKSMLEKIQEFVAAHNPNEADTSDFITQVAMRSSWVSYDRFTHVPAEYRIKLNDYEDNYGYLYTVAGRLVNGEPYTAVLYQCHTGKRWLDEWEEVSSSYDYPELLDFALIATQRHSN